MSPNSIPSPMPAFTGLTENIMNQNLCTHVSSSVIVIFGGASGIGLATAMLALPRFGHVIIADIAPDGPDLAIVETGQAKFKHCDATEALAVDALLTSIVEQFGRLDAVITTVGGAHLYDPLVVDIEAWHRELGFNLDSAYLVAVTAAKYMKQYGGGSIVTTSSTIAQVPRPERLGYAAAKAGVIALTKGLALAVAADGICVNCVAPHSTDTPRFRALIGDEAALEARVDASPQKRISVPDDHAQAILFLVSEAAKSITGQVLWVNNGNYMP